MRLTRLIFAVALALLGLRLMPVNAAGSRCYVNVSASGANNGSSWANAYIDLQSALANGSCTEIWVAAGTYYPTSDGDRSATFQLKDGVVIYGGFTGTEYFAGQRNADPATNNAVLSGDIGTPDDNSDNSYHVVTASGTDASAVLDGFTITDGNANDSSVTANKRGAGLYDEGGSPSISNIVFSNGWAAVAGGGMYSHNGSPTLVDVTFAGNTSNQDGGGMAISGGDPSLTNITFSNNHAFLYGGGLYIDKSSPALTNLTFADNRNLNYGGGLTNFNDANPTLTNVTFSANHANYGGGIYNFKSSPVLTNVTFADNTSDHGRAMYNQVDCSPTLTNVIMWDGGNEIGHYQTIHSISYSDIQGSGGSGASWLLSIGTDGGHNLDADPLLGPLADNGGYTQTIALQTGSPAIDSAADASCPATDQRGVARPQGLHCDMGAYEVEIRSLSPGQVLGCGWIDSPTDAYVSAPSVGGPAELCVAFFYNHGVDGPVGSNFIDSILGNRGLIGGTSLESGLGLLLPLRVSGANVTFTLPEARFSFQSTTLQSVVIDPNGTVAQLMGNGAINHHLGWGADSYQFMVRVVDSQPNTVYIRIWWSDADGTQHVVYDNGSDQPLSRGGIRIGIH